MTMRNITVDQLLADRRRMKPYIATRIPEEGCRIVLAEGDGGEDWAEIDPVRYPDGEWDVHFETNAPEWVGLREICEHFRRQEMSVEEWGRELCSGIDHVRGHEAEHELVPAYERQDRPCLTVIEAAERLACSISFVYKLMSQGELAYETRGRRKLPSSESVAMYRLRNTVPARPAPSRVVKPPKTTYQFKYLFQRDKARRGALTGTERHRLTPRRGQISPAFR
jgi:excisionase family DNA binding protein